MDIFLYNLYIFVWIQHFWGPPLNCLLTDSSYNVPSNKDVPVCTTKYCLLKYLPRMQRVNLWFTKCDSGENCTIPVYISVLGVLIQKIYV